MQVVTQETRCQQHRTGCIWSVPAAVLEDCCSSDDPLELGGQKSEIPSATVTMKAQARTSDFEWLEDFEKADAVTTSEVVSRMGAGTRGTVPRSSQASCSEAQRQTSPNAFGWEVVSGACGWRRTARDDAVMTKESDWSCSAGKRARRRHESVTQ